MNESTEVPTDGTGDPTRHGAEIRKGNSSEGCSCSGEENEDARASRPGLTERTYPALRRSARKLMRGERAGHTLQATALAHEAWIRLARRATLLTAGATWIRRNAFMYMRRILQDDGRRRGRIKHGDGWRRVPLNEAREMAASSPDPSWRHDDARAIQEALEKLENTIKSGNRERRVLELHFFEGYSFTEIAERVGVSDRQVRRDWRHARVWLHRELARKQG